MKDRLFLLTPGFFNGQHGPLYCGDSLPIEGLLSLFPSLGESIDVVHVAFQKPREKIVAVLGEGHQSAPVLVLATDAVVADDLPVKISGGERFIDDEKAIRQYLSARFNLPTAS